MKNSLKGALLSGLVFPGLGQVALKRRAAGIALIAAVAACLTAIVVIAVRRAFAVLDRIESAGGAVDMSTITATAAQVSTPSGSVAIYAAILLIALCWVVGIVDAYMAGRKKDIAAAQQTRRAGP